MQVDLSPYRAAIDAPEPRIGIVLYDESAVIDKPASPQRLADALLYVDSAAVDKPALPANPPNSCRDYVTRRYELLDAPTDRELSAFELGAISQLPLGIQRAFRVKMLMIFALQLLLVAAMVGACAYVPQVTDQLKTRFQGQIEYLVGASVSVVGLLVLLYFIRALFPLNWLVLLLFSAAQALLFAILGIKFDTNLGFFNCGATLSCVLIMLLLSGVRRRAPTQEIKLLSTITAGLIAYLVVALASCVLFGKYGREFITTEGFGASLGFQFVLVMWFAIDAKYMYRVMSPDEYMHGVLYFYTDMILAVIMAAVAVGVVTLVVLGSAEEIIGACIAWVVSVVDVSCRWFDCCFHLRSRSWCNRCCKAFGCCCKKTQKEEEPLVDDCERFLPGPAYLIPNCEDLHKKTGVQDLEMQRV